MLLSLVQHGFKGTFLLGGHGDTVGQGMLQLRP